MAKKTQKDKESVKQENKIIIITGPGGVGKTTISQFLCQNLHGKFKETVSCTTRAKRECEEDGKEVIRCIENIEFSAEYYRANDLDGSIYYIVPGASAYAEFDELNVKTIKVTVEVPQGQENVGISEVKILGK